MTMTAPEYDVLALAAFRRLANALREAAVELRGPTLARDSALYEAGQAVDELADLVIAETGDPADPRPTGSTPDAPSVRR
jgi:hypothetical protein